MNQPIDTDEFIENFLEHAKSRDKDYVKEYNRRYYLRTRKLKGRSTKTSNIRDEKRIAKKTRDATKKKSVDKLWKVLSKHEDAYLRLMGLGFKSGSLPPGPEKDRIDREAEILAAKLEPMAKKLEAEAKKLGVEKELNARFRQSMGLG